MFFFCKIIFTSYCCIAKSAIHIHIQSSHQHPCTSSHTCMYTCMHATIHKHRHVHTHVSHHMHHTTLALFLINMIKNNYIQVSCIHFIYTSVLNISSYLPSMHGVVCYGLLSYIIVNDMHPWRFKVYNESFQTLLQGLFTFEYQF